MEHKHKKILYGVHRQSSSGSLEVKLPKALTMSFFAKKNVHVHRSGNNEVKSERYREDKK